MPRPPKCRRVEYLPQLTYFKPAGIPLRQLQEVSLSVEELEAIRLKDMVDLEQEACAERMRVSRPTFCRILESARAKLADALVTGKAIKIEGGNYLLAKREFECYECTHHWEIPFGTGTTGKDIKCPICASTNTRRIDCTSK
jgi:predicted DNA-binding protein (UPF0251 family)